MAAPHPWHVNRFLNTIGRVLLVREGSSSAGGASCPQFAQNKSSSSRRLPQMGHCRSSIMDPKPSRRRSGTPVVHCVGVLSVKWARQACPSDLRRDRVVRFVPRCDALIASDAQPLIIHPTSPGTTTLCVSHHLHICRPHVHTLTSNLIIPYLIFAFHDFDRSLLIRLQICPPRNFHPRTNQEATHSFSPVLSFVIMAKKVNEILRLLDLFLNCETRTTC